jgi:predicted nucleic acid-binding protein
MLGASDLRVVESPFPEGSQVKKRPRVYLETSVVSYLTARRSSNILAAAHQLVTREWWETRRKAFDLLTSSLVLDEARLGDPEAARRRLEVLEEIPLVEVNGDANDLAARVIRDGLLPLTAFADAVHLATATVHRVDYLLTWNCAHIANAEILPRVARMFEEVGWERPAVCTPEELMGGVP